MANFLSMLGLGKSEECRELAAIVDAVSQTQAMIEFDTRGNIVDANDNFLSVMGYRKDEIVGMHHRMFVEDQYSRSSDYDRFWDRLARGERFVQDFYRVGKNGKPVWIQGSYNPIRNSRGEVTKVVKFATDITERKQEEDRNKKTAQLASALKLCQAGVMLVENDGKIVYLNDTGMSIFKGCEEALRSELRGFSASALVDSDLASSTGMSKDLAMRIKEVSKAFSEDMAVAGETFGLIVSPWYDEQGNRLGSVLEWDRKTERLVAQRQTEMKTQENMRIRQALDVCNTPVMLADADMVVQYMNTSAESMLREREATIKKSIPAFSVKTLIGTCIDKFHKNPERQRKMLSESTSSYETDINIADLTFGLVATPIFDKNNKFIGTIVEWDDKTERLALEAEEKRQANENARVKLALDSVNTNVMIADIDANIVYLNESVVTMMRNAQNDIRKELPNFDANNLKGKNMDIFHKNPSHQRNLLNKLTTSYTGTALVGGRTFTVTANPVIVDGERLGTVVEWNDRTEEVAIEREIDAIIEAAAAGDFTKQISMDGKSGFFGKLGGGLNDLISTVEVALNDIIRMLGAMARGDLSERITRDYVGSFGTMKSDANTTADKLTEVITKIRTASSAIGSAANEIAQGNSDLSQRTEEQASSLEETASSMEEMTATVKQSSENAGQASKLATEAQSKAQQGGQVVSKAVKSMEEINASSKRISDIIGVIDEIAFQTNLLALNAAVEAARAGEQGRGFAVVAGEVRNLAQRSAGAAKEIKDLIRDSVGKVQDGTNLVNESGKTLSEIVAAVENVTSMMREIADASREQTSGIEQVNTAVSQMDEMTQQNAALVEEASAAGEAMAEQARSLTQIVDFFSVSGHGEKYRAQPAAAPRQTTMSTKSKSSAPAPTRNDFESDDEWEDF